LLDAFDEAPAVFGDGVAVGDALFLKMVLGQVGEFGGRLFPLVRGGFLVTAISFASAVWAGRMWKYWASWVWTAVPARLAMRPSLLSWYICWRGAGWRFSQPSQPP